MAAPRARTACLSFARAAVPVHLPDALTREEVPLRAVERQLTIGAEFQGTVLLVVNRLLGVCVCYSGVNTARLASCSALLGLEGKLLGMNGRLQGCACLLACLLGSK